MNIKVIDLKPKLNSLDTRVTETENFCQFSTAELEANKNNLKTTKDGIKRLKKVCNETEKNSRILS